jgi:hypothetical protein
MKKLLSIAFIAAILAVSSMILTGCGGDEPESRATIEPESRAIIEADDYDSGDLSRTEKEALVNSEIADMVEVHNEVSDLIAARQGEGHDLDHLVDDFNELTANLNELLEVDLRTESDESLDYFLGIAEQLGYLYGQLINQLNALGNVGGGFDRTEKEAWVSSEIDDIIEIHNIVLDLITAKQNEGFDLDHIIDDFNEMAYNLNELAEVDLGTESDESLDYFIGIAEQLGYMYGELYNRLSALE